MLRTPTTLFVCLALLTLPLATADYPMGPGAPGDLSAAAGPDAGAITLAWSAAPSLTGVTSYTVYRADDSGSLVPIATVDAQTLGYTDAGLANGATFTYVVTATDAAGEGPESNPATATTFTAPDAPQDVAAAPGAVGTVGEILVTWSTPGADGGLALTGYNVFRDGKLVATVPGNATSWSDTGRDAAQEHTYRVSAINDAGEGPQSDAACGMASPWGLVPEASSCIGLDDALPSL